MNRRAKFWLFFLLGICLYLPFFFFSVMVQMPLAVVSFFLGFLVYCYGLYRLIQKKVEPKYPVMPPEGRMTDIYFPRSRIPRPIHEDVRRYPRFFKQKKIEKWEKKRKVKKS